MLKSKAILFSSILFCSCLFLTGYPVDTSIALTLITDDWDIIVPTVIENDIIILNGNLTVFPTGKMTLDNTTLIINCSYDGEYFIKVKANGELNVMNNSTIKSYSSTNRYDFYYEKYSKGIVSYSTITNAGWDYFTGSHGLSIASDNIIVENSTFENNYIDIWIDDSSPLIKNNRIITKVDMEHEPGEQFQLGGIDLWHNPNPQILNNYIANSKYGITFEDTSDAIIKNNIIENTIYGGISISGSDSYPMIVNNKINNCGSGIGTYEASPLIYNNTINNSKHNGFWIYRSTPDLIDNIIYNSSEYDIALFANSYPISLNNIFNKDKVMLKYKKLLGNPSLTVQWYLKVMVIDENNNSLKDANVIVTDINGLEIYNGTTDSDGYTGTIICTEYFQQDLNNDTDGNDTGEKIYYTPHNITVTVDRDERTFKAYKELMITESMETTVLVDFSPPSPDLSVSEEHIAFSNDSPKIGDIVNINATAFNIGERAAVSAELVFYDNEINDDFQIGQTCYLTELNPNESAEFSVEWDTSNLSSGTHSIHVVIINSTPFELELSNNQAIKSIYLISNQNPVANLIVNRTTINEREMVLFDASNSSDNDGFVEEFYYRFGDGQESGWIRDTKIIHQYKTEGIYTASLTVRDNNGAISRNTASVMITVSRINHAPVIENILIDTGIVKPNGIVIIRVEAFDADKDDLIYFYNCSSGDIINEDEKAYWQAPPTEGIYTISIKVYDGILYSETKNIFIQVHKNNTSPIIEDIIIEPEIAKPGEDVLITVIATDEDPGDELIFIYNVTYGSIEGNGTSVIWHAPQEEGTYELTVIVIDKLGDEVKETVQIIVEKSQDSKEKIKEKIDIEVKFIMIFLIIVIIVILIIFYMLLKKPRSYFNINDKQFKEIPLEAEELKDLDEDLNDK